MEEVSDGLESLQEENLLQDLPGLHIIKEMDLCSSGLPDHIHLSPGSRHIHRVQLEGRTGFI